jgi:anthranilate synthase component 2
MILLIDNYDSFTYNLAQLLPAVRVVRNDAVTLAEIEALAPTHIVLSPGPGHPKNARDIGVCRELLESGTKIPILGVCLGMQAMAQFTGGKVTAAPTIVHGEAKPTELAEHPIFAGIRSPAMVGRYHSFCVDEATLPAEWSIIARADVPMAMAHNQLPRIGVQFHPESILTPDGNRMIQNFLETK